MIKQNLGYIISAIVILISIFLIINKINENQKILHNTSSAKTVREEEPNKNVKENNYQNKSITHTIKSGDTLWDLAILYYGDGTKYHEIIKKNPGKTFKFKNGNEGLIYPGTELKI